MYIFDLLHADLEKALQKLGLASPAELCLQSAIGAESFNTALNTGVFSTNAAFMLVSKIQSPHAAGANVACTDIVSPADASAPLDAAALATLLAAELQKDAKYAEVRTVRGYINVEFTPAFWLARLHDSQTYLAKNEFIKAKLDERASTTCSSTLGQYAVENAVNGSFSLADALHTLREQTLRTVMQRVNAFSSSLPVLSDTGVELKLNKTGENASIAKVLLETSAEQYANTLSCRVLKLYFLDIPSTKTVCVTKNLARSVFTARSAVNPAYERLMAGTVLTQFMKQLCGAPNWSVKLAFTKLAKENSGEFSCFLVEKRNFALVRLLALFMDACCIAVNTQQPVRLAVYHAVLAQHLLQMLYNLQLWPTLMSETKTDSGHSKRKEIELLLEHAAIVNACCLWLMGGDPSISECNL